MADKVQLETGSKEKVAYDLMILISNQEDDTEKYLKPDPRTYYLTLFRQCIRASSLGVELDTTSPKEK